MAVIQSASIHPVVRLIGNRMKELDSNIFLFKSARAAAAGHIDLVSPPCQSLTGWEAGFFQFAFTETNCASYRGLRESDGGARVRNSHEILCRDTVAATGAALWYAPAATARPPAAMPGSGTVRLDVPFADEPSAPVLKTVQRTPAAPLLTLHHFDCLMRFCTILVARTHDHQFVPLKHFYWNFRVEAFFRRDSSGQPHLERVVHAAANVQGSVHSGLPNDSRFASHFTDTQLPTANATARRIGLHHLSHPTFTAGWA